MQTTAIDNRSDGTIAPRSGRSSLRRSLLTTCLIGFLTLAGGCDRAYHYMFYPPERIEYTLAPDPSLMYLANDTCYSLSQDSSSIVYDRKSFKIEVKPLSDYQLNTFEFPDDSKEGALSANPFTFANWVDPQLGYTPTRFSVFKISIYNYTASKLNFDPESSFLVTDRGDILAGYGREEKSSRNQSIESYFKRRKGSSGVDNDVFERRMGIVRQTVLYLGRPIYQGDSREGLVVYDPLDESVDKVKLVLKNFITAYDENNEPSGFLDLEFFFKRVPLMKESLNRALAARADSSKKATPSSQTANAGTNVRDAAFEIHQIRFRLEGRGTEAEEQDWNARPNALPALVSFLKDSLKVRPTLKVSPADSPELLNAKLMFMFVGPSKPTFIDAEVIAMANSIRRGGFLFIDNSVFTTNFQYYDQMVALIQNIGSRLGDQVRVMPVPNDNEIYKIWGRLSGPPVGQDDIENMPDKRNYLEGLFWKDKLVAVVSSKGYSIIWDQRDPASFQQFVLGANIAVYALTSLKGQ
jgi:hypothetical protein